MAWKLCSASLSMVRERWRIISFLTYFFNCFSSAFQLGNKFSRDWSPDIPNFSGSKLWCVVSILSTGFEDYGYNSDFMSKLKSQNREKFMKINFSPKKHFLSESPVVKLETRCLISGEKRKIFVWDICFPRNVSYGGCWCTTVSKGT